jgi:hypothetical protein
MSADEVRALARVTSTRLREAGRPIESVYEKTVTTETRVSGFLGRKKETVSEQTMTEIPLGWFLWRQHLEQWEVMGTPDYTTVMKIMELWLTEDGELSTATSENSFFHPNDQRNWGRVSVTPASDDELTYPDREWVESNGPPEQRVMRDSKWHPVPPRGAPTYDGLSRALEKLEAAEIVGGIRLPDP